MARLAAGVYWALGDTSIEWATENGTVWLLQTAPAGPVAGAAPAGTGRDAPPTAPGPTMGGRARARNFRPGRPAWSTRPRS